MKNRELESINNELKTFTSIAAYDYKETLQQLYVNFEFIISRDVKNLSDSGKANIRKAQAAIQKMKLLTDDIVSFSRLQELDPVLSDIDLNSILKETIIEVQEKYDNTDMGVESDIFPTIKGFPMLIHLLFFHLLGNAIKFRHSERPLQIKLTYEVKKDRHLGTDMHQISFSDNGIGFPQEEASKIIKMFYRIHDRKYKGSGVGLAICKKIIDLHGGTMAIESHADKGTMICCFFPIE